MALKREADLFLEKSLESTNRIVRILEDTHEVGAATLSELDRQGQQLHRIGETLDHIDHNIRQADKTIKGMSLKYFLFPFLRPSSSKALPTIQAAPAPTSASSASVAPASVAPVLLCNDPRELQISANINTMAQMVSSMKKMSLQMSDVLDEHDELLDHIIESTEQRHGRLAKVTGKVNKMIS